MPINGFPYFVICEYISVKASIHLNKRTRTPNSCQLHFDGVWREMSMITKRE